MDTLSTAEAELFTKLCGYVWAIPMTDRRRGENTTKEIPTIITPPNTSELWQPDADESRLLEDSGLAYDSALENVSSEANGARLTFGGRILELQSEKPRNIRIGRLRLTAAGGEIYKLATPEYSKAYLGEILEEWRSRGWTITER